VELTGARSGLFARAGGEVINAEGTQSEGGGNAGNITIATKKLIVPGSGKRIHYYFWQGECRKFDSS
jgi:hypothetical protein